MRRILAWFVSPMAMFCFAGANCLSGGIALSDGNPMGLVSLVVMVFCYHFGMVGMLQITDVAMVMGAIAYAEGRVTVTAKEEAEANANVGN